MLCYSQGTRNRRNRKNRTNREQNEQSEQSVEERMLELIKENPKVAQSYIAKVLNINSRSKVERIMNQLKTNGLIDRKRADRSGEWILMNKEQKEQKEQNEQRTERTERTERANYRGENNTINRRKP